MDQALFEHIPRAHQGFAFIVGLFATIVALPPLIRAAGASQLLDIPNQRNIHEVPVPRVGGLAIGLGVLAPILIWTSLTPFVLAFLAAALIVLVGGILDDIKRLSYAWKLGFQAVAIGLVMSSGLLIRHVPFCGLDPVSLWVSYPLTFIALVGVTNATNLFDGLDGLAGGCIFLTFGAIAALAYLADSSFIVLIALAAIGGVLGFLRFNTHPATVFMGDSGSQLLGFIAAVLTILLVERAHTALNPALTLLILGLPVLDTLMVMFLRIKQGKSPFKADRQHLHHQLLALGFRHYEAVAMLYLIQAIMVATAFALKYQSDLVVSGAFLGFCGFILGSIFLAKRAGVQVHSPNGRVERDFVGWREYVSGRVDALASVVDRYLEYSLAALFLAIAVFSLPASRDFAILGFGGAAALLFAFLFMKRWALLFSRLGVYSVALITIYLSAPLFRDHYWVYFAVNTYLLSLVACAVFVIILSRLNHFQLTPQDFLILVIALAIPSFSSEFLANFPLAGQTLRAGILVYACEIVISTYPHKHRALKASTFLSLIVVAGKTVILGG